MKKRLLASLLTLALWVSLATPAAAAASPFKDVPVNSWYYAPIMELYNRKLVSGYGDNIFFPDGTVTLGEALKMILLAAGYPAQKAVDGHWASGYFALAKSKGLLPAGRFNTLNSNISRLQIAELACKALGLGRSKSVYPFSDSKDTYALIAYDHGLFLGQKDGNRLWFLGGDTITRAEMSAVACRVLQKKGQGGSASSAAAGNNSGTYIQFAGTKVYVAEDIPKNPYDPSHFQFNSNGYLTYDDSQYTCRIGVDVSKYQGKIDWAKVKASGVDFAILRLGYRGYSSGKLAMDETFYTNLKNAQAAGIQVGVYFSS